MIIQFLINGYKNLVILLQTKRSKLSRPFDAILMARMYPTQIGCQEPRRLKLDREMGLPVVIFLIIIESIM